MGRISAAFSQARQEKRALFIAYLCAGDPDFEGSLAACRAVLEAGADILELGAPFSDPLADGVPNQLAAQRALSSGFRSSDLFRIAARLREEFPERALVVYTYFNLVCANGIASYVESAHEAGVDGLLVLDLPPEEATELLAVSRSVGMANIFIVAPTTPEHRIRLIAEAGNGFLYYVSREGVTGEQETLSQNIGDALTRIRNHTEMPIVVGFGVSRAEHVREVASVADGVVVGSTLVKCIPIEPQEPTEIANRLRKRMGELLQDSPLAKE